MAGSSRFVVGVHLLVLLALEDPESLSSEVMASSVRTNPVVVRRTLSAFRRAGLVRSIRGRHGGFRLTRPAERISLAHVLSAVGADDLFASRPGEADLGCPVGAHLDDVLERHVGGAVLRLAQSLGETSIADLARAVTTRAAGSAVAT